MTERPDPYRVEAYNTAKLSENKMHDDTVAQKFGFTGGLVPGVEVVAYMIHPAVAKWGRAFLERGLIEGRFTKPVYDGETVLVPAVDTADGLDITVEGGPGDVRALGRAALPASVPAVSLADFPDTPPVATRAPVDEASYALNKCLGSIPRTWAADDVRTYMEEVREHDGIYAREGLVHPGVIQRVMNKVLVDNALMGPWIHVGSKMQLLAPVQVGDELTGRARVIANYDRKGHRFVELDAVVVANGSRIVAHCHHTAITQPRQLAAA